MPVTNLQNPHTLTVNLDGASRISIVAAACVLLNKAGARAGDLGEWRARAARWDDDELLHRASELGVKFKYGNEAFELPEVG
jgi:hypothetical protein